MDILVDGYNVIGGEEGLRGPLEHKRNRLLQQLSSYYKLKGYPVTVVFDGWRSGSGSEVEEKRDGLTIVYSQRGEKADSVIIRRARQKGSGTIVVTSDREIRNAVQRFGAVALYAGEFSAILRNLETADGYYKPESEPRLPKKGNPRRLSKNERKRREKLKKLKP
ncbi:MAG TPA: NYN domain-containing protein [Candidatus Binatia bacterium]|nr:NYN domain-containing protein [Candidatus Binatia bacterium]